MRKVKGHYHKYIADGGYYSAVDFEEGTFHEWGLAIEEYDNGGVSGTVAIVELPDGTIITPNPKDIQFIDNHEYEDLSFKLDLANRDNDALKKQLNDLYCKIKKNEGLKTHRQ